MRWLEKRRRNKERIFLMDAFNLTYKLCDKISYNNRKELFEELATLIQEYKNHWGADDGIADYYQRRLNYLNQKYSYS